MSETKLTTPLRGARYDSFLGYLKAIGLLRVLASQVDPAIGMRWTNGYAELIGIDLQSVRTFVLHDYIPTPVINPWNSGAGFDAKSERVEAGRTLRRVLDQRGSRWSDYRAAISTAHATLRAKAETFDTTLKPDLQKQHILLNLRRRLADRALEWLDAAVLVGKDRPYFPALLGSGGNDGRLDFSVNFMQRLLDVIGDDASAISPTWFDDAVTASSDAPLMRHASLGQFSLTALGGPNSSNGTSGHSLVNPWDYVLMLEGAIAFAGAVVRRFGSQSSSAPFLFASVGAGYASASAAEETRGELWLPRWAGTARYAAVRAVLRAGRVTLSTSVEDRRDGAVEVRSLVATDALAAVQSAQTLGVASGIEAFSRIILAQRNGLAYAGSYIGSVAVGARPELAALSEASQAWIKRIRINEDGLGARARQALRSYEEAIIAYAAIAREADATANLQDMLFELAELDAALPFGKLDLHPLRALPATMFDFLDCDLSPEHEVARALCSIGRSERHRLRSSISPIAFALGKAPAYDLSLKPVWFDDIRNTLASVLAKKVRIAIAAPDDKELGFTANFHGTAPIAIETLVRLFDREFNWKKLHRLIRAYSIIEPARRAPRLASVEMESPPVAFAALKILIAGVVANSDYEHSPSASDDLAGTRQTNERRLYQYRPGATYVDFESIERLRLGYSRQAFESAFARLRSVNFASRDFRPAHIDRDDARTYLAAMLVPISDYCYRGLKRTLLLI